MVWFPAAIHKKNRAQTFLSDKGQREDYCRTVEKRYLNSKDFFWRENSSGGKTFLGFLKCSFSSFFLQKTRMVIALSFFFMTFFQCTSIFGHRRQNTGYKINRTFEGEIRLIDFNGTSNFLQLFSAKRLGNGIHNIIIFTLITQLILRGFCAQLYDIKYSYLMIIISIKLYGFKYSYLILIIIYFQVIIFI